MADNPLSQLIEWEDKKQIVNIMRKVLDGKVYDTEKAELIASYSYSNSGDFRYESEDLYVTKKGNFFFEYAGGAMSKYRESVGNNSWSGSSGLRLPEEEYEDEAFNFMTKHGSVEDVLKYFPNQIEEA